MDFSFVMAAYAIRTMNHEARSALPDAPVVAPPPPGQPSRSAAFARRRLAPLKGWLAGALHQAAWAIEPDPRAVTGPGYLSAAAIFAEDRQSDTRPDNR
jgi:hypothetical protein